MTRFPGFLKAPLLQERTGNFDLISRKAPLMIGCRWRMLVFVQFTDGTRECFQKLVVFDMRHLLHRLVSSYGLRGLRQSSCFW
jgi:hypothetical protein